MEIPALRFRPADVPRPEPAVTRPALEGDAAPGDVLTLPGGALVRDANRNGLVDGADAVVRPDRLPWPALHIDVRG